jgi:hypothetical protein
MLMTSRSVSEPADGRLGGAGLVGAEVFQLSRRSSVW